MKHIFTAKLWISLFLCHTGHNAVSRSYCSSAADLMPEIGCLTSPRKPPANETMFHTTTTRFYTQQENICKLLNVHHQWNIHSSARNLVARVICELLQKTTAWQIQSASFLVLQGSRWWTGYIIIGKEGSVDDWDLCLVFIDCQSSGSLRNQDVYFHTFACCKCSCELPTYKVNMFLFPRKINMNVVSNHYSDSFRI